MNKAVVSLTDPFERLGLERNTATEDAVKASYATLLKQTRPEDDRDAFMALRKAFAEARAIAKANDARLATAPAPAATSEATVQAETPVPPPAQPEAVTWSYFEHLRWNIPNTPHGALIKEALEWMRAGGPDPDLFVARVAERLLAEPSLSETQFHTEIINYIVATADTDCQQDTVADWEVFDVAAPEWLTDDLMRCLAQDLRLLKTKPSQSWAARNYNVVLKLFEPVLEPSTKDGDAFASIDAATVFADEQDKSRKDDHGSYFDRKEMVWKDMSPVGRAMREIEAAINQGLWDLPDKVAAVLARDELQVIDEFQMLDARLRHLICNATGWQSQDRKLAYPPWLTPKLVSLLDDTFGWSRHYGRPGWERQQFGWLHNVISRDRRQQSGQQSFRPASELIPPRPAPKERSSVEAIVFLLFNKPLWILASYIGYRVLQTALRMVS